MKFDTNLLNIIACPLTHQPLRLASTQELIQLNKLITQERPQGFGQGTSTRSILENALIRSDNEVAYPIVEGIARLQPEDAIKMGAKN